MNNPSWAALYENRADDEDAYIKTLGLDHDYESPAGPPGNSNPTSHRFSNGVAVNDSQSAFSYYYHDSPGDAPRYSSPRSHKFSDSNGSNLSSYTTSSSMDSLSHSRYSSISRSHSSSISTNGDPTFWTSISDPMECPKSAPAHEQMSPHQSQLPRQTETELPYRSKLPRITQSPHQSSSLHQSQRPPRQTESPNQGPFPHGSQPVRPLAPNDDGGEKMEEDDITTENGLAPAEVLADIDAEPRCMLVKDCMENSQLRKVISHLFGRNKLCTRKIPKEIWAYSCRKHYQRRRYRNVTDFAKVQCELAGWQAKRIQAWSDRNKQRQSLGVLLGWTLGIRKRERNRREVKIDDPHATPPPCNRPSHPSLGGSLEPDPVLPSYDSRHALPEWLDAMVRENKTLTTQEVVQLFEEIARQLRPEGMCEVPDIEVLPSIEPDTKEDFAYKRYAKRNSQTHRRSHSTSSWQSGGREMSQYTPPAPVRTFWDPPETSGNYALGKRPRAGDSDEEYQPHSFPPMNGTRTVPVPDWSFPAAYLPPPLPQRSSALSTAQRPEATGLSNRHDPLRRPHERSRSDTSAFRCLPPMPTNLSSNGFNPVNGLSSSMSSFGHRPSFEYTPRPPHSSSAGNADSSRPPFFHLNNEAAAVSSSSSSSSVANGYGHARHQSTPALSLPGVYASSGSQAYYQGREQQPGYDSSVRNG